MTEEKLSTSRLAGQLIYLFEDQPDQRDASPVELAARLDHDDRYARARATYPNDNDTEIVARLDEFPSRISEQDVVAALETVAQREAELPQKKRKK